MRVKCLQVAQEHNAVTLAKDQTWTARSGVQRAKVKKMFHICTYTYGRWTPSDELYPVIVLIAHYSINHVLVRDSTDPGNEVVVVLTYLS